jgi:hypothetical protein
MKYFKFNILVLSTILLLSCSNKDRSVKIIQQGGNQFMEINIKGIRDSTRINLTDIADNLRFIPLETLPECLISRASYYITDKHILAKTRTAIFQFDGNGRFVRILALQGQGPMEFSSAEWVVDEKKDLLILADEQKPNHFMSFDLKTGAYHGNIPKAIPGVTRKFALTPYGSLACVPYMNPGDHPNQFYLYWQNLEGTLLDTVKGPPDLAIYRDNYLQPTAEGYRYMLAINNSDTIYSLENKALKPYLTFNHGEDVPKNMETVGFRNMKIALETSNFLFLFKNQISEVNTNGPNTSTSWISSEYVFDKNQNQAFLASGVYNNFVGATQPVQFFKALPNGFIYCSFQSLELIGIADRALDSPKSDQKLIHRMTQIRDQIGREDNPVLLVGQLR